MLNEIKWAWQRVVRGYDERITWGFDTYFIQIIPALDVFCHAQLQQEHIDLNPKRKEVFEKTIRLIYNYQTAMFFDEDEPLAELAAYFGENINIYWD